MKSSLKSVIRKAGMALATLGLAAAMFMAVTSRAQALTISVGTPTIVSGVAIDQYSAATDGDRVHVVFSTVDATAGKYSVMYASNTLGGGYSITMLSSGAIANKPNFMDLVINPADGKPHVYYYDKSSQTINGLQGTSANTAPLFILGNAQIASLTGLNAQASGAGCIILYSSQAATGRYALNAASITFSATDSVASSMVIVSTTAFESVASGNFTSVLMSGSTGGQRLVFYYDDISAALKAVTVDVTGIVLDTSREVLDTGSGIGNLYAGDGNSVTEITYTHPIGIKVAKQNRTFARCWYIQKVDDGSAAQAFAVDGSGNPQVTYLQSGNLFLALGKAGYFFDDFSEYIVNAQRGKGSIVNGVKSGGVLLNQGSTGAKARGVLQQTGSNGLASINWLVLSGNVQTSLGSTNIPAVSVRSKSAEGVSASADDLNPAIAGTAGGVTDTSGNYDIFVGSSNVNAVSASSSGWVFVWSQDFSTVTVSTTATDVFASNGITVNFIGVSSPTLLNIQPSSGSVVGIIPNEPAGTASFTINLSSPSNSSLAGNNYALSMNARLVPNGTTIMVSTSVLELDNLEAGAIPLSGNPSGITTWTSASTNTLWSGFVTTASPTTSQWYDLVVATRLASGQIMQGTKAKVFELKPLIVGVSSGTLFSPTLSISTSLYNTSRNSGLIVRSTSPYINQFSNGLIQNGNVWLTTSTYATSIATSALDVKLGVSALGVDSYKGGSEFFYTTGTLLGADYTKTYYVRITSLVVNNLGTTQPQIAFSPAISISSPVITGIRYENSNEADTASNLVITSTGSNKVFLYGRGFVSPSTCTIGIDNTSTLNGMPTTYINSLVFNVITSTFAQLVISTVPMQLTTAGNQFYIAITSATGGVGNYFDDCVGVMLTTITARANAYMLSVGTPSVTRVTVTSNAVVTNTLTYGLDIIGRGLPGGATIYFVANDGSGLVLTSTASDLPLAGGLPNIVSKLHTDVDFRGGAAYAGKTYNMVISSTVLNFDGTLSSATTINFSSAVTVSSITLDSFVTPESYFTDGLYNSTGSVTIMLSGKGLLAGATVSVVSLSSGIAITPLYSGTTVATFVTTAAFNATAGNYTITISSVVSVGNKYAGLGTFSVSASTTIAIYDEPVPTLNTQNQNYATLSGAQFMVTGKGLIDGATTWLVPAVAGAAITGNFGTVNAGTINSVNRTTATVTFDLREATYTGNYTMYLVFPMTDQYTNQFNRTQNLGNITVSPTPVVSSLISYANTTKRNNADNVLTLAGNGLSQGATVFFHYLDGATTPGGFNGNSIALSSADFQTDNSGAVLVTTVTFTSGTVVTVDFPANKMPGRWAVQVSSLVSGGLSAYSGASGRLAGDINYASAQTGAIYTVVESSAPNAPTGLTVLASGIKSVTLQWVSPGDDGSIGNLTTGSKFIVYYSSSSNNGTRGLGCAACYPVGVVNSFTGAQLIGYATNYNFANTWAQFLPYGTMIDGDNVTTTLASNISSATFGTQMQGNNTVYTGAYTAKGLLVSTITLGVGDVAVSASTNAAGTTGNTSIAPGSIITATLTIDPGVRDGNYWFIVRAMDEAGNISSSLIAYSTASAKILQSAAASAVLAGGNPVINPGSDNTVTYTIINGAANGVTVNSVEMDVPAGSLAGADTFLTPVVNTNPPADSGGCVGVGASLDIKTANGAQDFLKAITINITVNASQLAAVLNGRSSDLVKLAFFNGSRWVIVAESSLGSNGSVSGKVTHLTQFRVVIAGPASNMNGAMVYPNPFRPTSVNANDKVTFDQIPANTSIKIYTLSGGLVRELSGTVAGTATWDGKNKNGQDVASGVYFALLDGGGDKKTLKVAVQR